jgi:hypothetical protein
MRIQRERERERESERARERARKRERGREGGRGERGKGPERAKKKTKQDNEEKETREIAKYKTPFSGGRHTRRALTKSTLLCICKKNTNTGFPEVAIRIAA